MKLAKIILLISGFFPSWVFASVFIIVNKELPVTAVDLAEVSNLFLGKSNRFSDNTKIIPVDQEEGESVRDEFYSKVANKDASQLNAYWSRLIFTGKGQPPKAVLDSDEVVELVGSDPTYIGYVDMAADSLPDNVKVVLTVP